MKRGEFIVGGAGLAAAGRLLAGESESAPEKAAPEKVAPLAAVAPPGCRSVRRFVSKCSACGLCISSCPGKALRASGIAAYGLGGFMMPRLDFREGFCAPDCRRCAEVCPAGAIELLPEKERARLRVGVAEYRKWECVTEKDGNSCGLCAERCPKQAIKMVKPEGAKFAQPVVDAGLCVGCGTCEHYCPAKPKAMVVRGLADQDFAFGADTLVAYFADGGEWTSQARGVKPLLDALDKEKERFSGARCYDRVVGRAAAFLYAALGVKFVFAPVMSKPAARLLAHHGIASRGITMVEGIRNRANDGSCPMDAAVADVQDAAVDAAVAAIRAAYAKLVEGGR